MATPLEYQIGKAALAAIIKQAIADNVPPSLEWAVEQRQALIDALEGKGAHAVIDAVDAQRAKVEALKGMA